MTENLKAEKDRWDVNKDGMIDLDEWRAYVNGKDPTTGKPVMQEVIEGLTRGLAGVERSATVATSAAFRPCEE